LAALRGDLARLLGKRTALEKEEAKLRTRIAALELVVAPLPVPEGVTPPAKVNAHSRYGGRGSLNAALLAVLRNAGHQGVSTLVIRQAVAEHFDVPAESASEREYLRELVTRRLRHLAKDSLVEQLPSTDPSKTNVVRYWRIAGKTGPTLGDLQRMADAAVSAEGASEPGDI